jgi:hypothetical protein
VRRHLSYAALVAVFASVLAPPAAARADGLDEFEAGFIWPDTNGNTPADTAASGGRAVELWDAASVDVWFTNSTPTTTVRIRARQEQCGPDAAQMAVAVDGVTVGTVTVSATTWTSYPVTGNWPAGSHQLRVEFTNPYFGDCGARELFLDNVVSESAPPASATYYVSPTGLDSNAGTSAAAPWKTIGKVNATALAAGTTVLFQRDRTFPAAALVADNPGVTYGAYGTGAAPVLDGDALDYPVVIQAANVTLQDLLVRDGGKSDKIGVSVAAPDALLQRITATGNAIGVQAQNGAHRLRLTASTLRDNTTVINPDGKGKAQGSTDDYGANGAVVLQADNVEIDHNQITGNVGTSADFGQDGSAVEIYGSIGTRVHHNTSVDNQTFTELGNARTRDTVFADNLVTTNASMAGTIGFNAQGTGAFGPVAATSIHHNTVVLRGTGTQGVVIGTGATASLHNTIVQAAYLGWTGQKIDEGHNVYFGGAAGNDIDSLAKTGKGVAATSVTANPLFVNTTDYRLQTGSPARNRGVSAYGITTDLDGNPRVVGPGPDAGAYELQ